MDNIIIVQNVINVEQLITKIWFECRRVVNRNTLIHSILNKSKTMMYR